MKCITTHWPGGTHEPSEYEKSRYHFLINGAGKVIEGDRPPEANKSPLGPDYVRHCGGYNSDNIGVAICGMRGAKERPFAKGSHPITAAAYNAAIVLVADLCETYGIKVTRRTVFLHSEVRERFGRGKYKWDVNWLPGMSAPGVPTEMGDRFREAVTIELQSRKASIPPFWRRLQQFLNRTF